MFDNVTGVVKFLPNLPTQWIEAPAGARIREATGLPTALINDVRAFPVAEHTPGAAAPNPPLTTIAQPGTIMAKTPSSLRLERLGGNTEDGPRHIVLEPLDRDELEQILEDILESEEESDGRLRQNGSVAFRSLVGVPRVYFYVWPHAKRPPGALLHAKAVIVDGHTALVTSANMTESAISANIEIGSLIRGGDAPARIHDHVKALSAAGEFAITVPQL